MSRGEDTSCSVYASCHWTLNRTLSHIGSWGTAVPTMLLYSIFWGTVAPIARPYAVQNHSILQHGAATVIREKGGILLWNAMHFGSCLGEILRVKWEEVMDNENHYLVSIL